MIFDFVYKFLTCRTIFLWIANLAMMWARSRWPLYLQAGSTQALGSRQGQAKVMRRLSLLFLLLLLSWMWWGACSTSSVENCSRLILSESKRSDCFSGSSTCETGTWKQTYILCSSKNPITASKYRDLRWVEKIRLRVTDRPGTLPWLMPDWGRDNQFECETNGGYYPPAFCLGYNPIRDSTNTMTFNKVGIYFSQTNISLWSRVNDSSAVEACGITLVMKTLVMLSGLSPSGLGGPRSCSPSPFSKLYRKAGCRMCCKTWGGKSQAKLWK